MKKTFLLITAALTAASMAFALPRKAAEIPAFGSGTHSVEVLMG